MEKIDLMIGDWVQVHQFYIDEETEEKVFYYEKPIYMQVGAVYQDLIATIAPWTDPKDESTYDEALLEEIEPIPLTAEILEKNGLKYEVDYGGYHRSILGSHSKDNEPLICVQWNPQGEISQWEVSNKSGILTGVVAYGYTAIAVHELQHILRMVGLNELANNFKI